MKKHYLIYIALLVIALAGCEKKEKDRCYDFRTGTFRFLKPEFKRFKVVRTESTQTETDSISGLTLVGDIKWTSPCNYQITYTKVSDPKYASVIGSVTNIQILAVFDKKLTVKSVGVGGTMESEMIKTAR